MKQLLLPFPTPATKDQQHDIRRADIHEALRQVAFMFHHYRENDTAVPKLDGWSEAIVICEHTYRVGVETNAHYLDRD